MNSYQEVWWRQVQSDHAVLLRLRRQPAEPCHQLHYLQMVTEKLGKAYFWRSGKPPGKSHKSFVRFLQALDDRPEPDRTRIARLLGFQRAASLESWIVSIAPLAFELQGLAPSLAGDGPNPEYPWPTASPRFAPATFPFGIWEKLVDQDRGRRFLIVIDCAVRAFPQLA